jgi:hypothetical protein
MRPFALSHSCFIFWMSTVGFLTVLRVGHGLERRGSRVRFPAGAGNIFSIAASLTAPGPSQPPVQWVPRALSLWVKCPGREADQSPPSSAEVKNAWSYTSTPPNKPSWRSAQKKAQRQLHLHLYLFPATSYPVIRHVICAVIKAYLNDASRPALGPTQPPIQLIPAAVSLGVKRLGREADHSPPSSTEVKNAWSYTSTLPIRLHGVMLRKKAQGLYLKKHSMEGGVEIPSHGCSHLKHEFIRSSLPDGQKQVRSNRT